MIRIICVGKIKEQYLKELIEDYYKRINKYHNVEIIELKDSELNEEGQLIMKNIKNRDFVVTLEIEGQNLSSIELSYNLNQWMIDNSNIDFIIGGSNGISSIVKNRSNYQLSFGKNTFPHGLFRGILIEQLYRSFKILNNESYHK